MVAPYKPYSIEKSGTFSFFTEDGRRFEFQRFLHIASGVSQKPPYINTTYHSSYYYTVKGPSHASNWNANYTAVCEEAKVVATNKARAKLVDQLGDTSSIGATMTAERKETFGMLTDGVTNILRSAIAIRKGQLVEAARILGVAPPPMRTTVKVKRKRNGSYRKVTRKVLTLPSGREVSQSLGNKWLWWSYGAKPLIEDSYNTLDVLQREIPWKRISGYSRHKYKTTYANDWYFEDLEADCKVGISVNVRLKNPNLYLANQLGLTNPVQWINEAIPFSFVVDWFSNLSQVISQMTDFVGLEIDDPITSIRTEFSYKYGSTYKGFRDLSIERTAKLCSRTQVIPDAKLKFAYERFSWQRGANAISLLVQFLEKTKR